jgi:hypothetical protein
MKIEYGPDACSHVSHRDRIAAASSHTQGAVATTRVLYIGRITRIDLNNGAGPADLAGLAGVTALAEIPINFGVKHG